MTQSEFTISDPFLRKIVYAIGIMTTIALGFYTLNLLSSTITVVLNVLTPFVAALLVGYILSPIVMALQKRLKLGRIMGTFLLYLILLLVSLVIVGILIPKIITEFLRMYAAFKTALPVIVEKISENEILKLDERIVTWLQNNVANMEIDLEKIAKSALPGLKSMAEGGLKAVGMATKQIFSGIGSVISFFTFVGFVWIISFYMILDWERIGPIIEMQVPVEKRERFMDILNKLDHAVGGFLRGQITVSIIVGTLFAIGLFIIGFFGFPTLTGYCILIGTAAAIGGFIPYLGALIGVTPAILIVLFSTGVGWTTKLIALIAVAGLFSAIQAVEGFILQPRIVGKGAGLHPIVVMLALIFGGQFGIGGMIIAVPLASMLRVLVLEFYWNPLLEKDKTFLEDAG